MEENLKKILTLYGEFSETSDGSSARSADDVREEEDFARIKQALDARPRRRPRPETVDAIVAAGRSTSKRGADRPARARMIHLALTRGSFAGVALLLVLFAWLYGPPRELDPGREMGSSPSPGLAVSPDATFDESPAVALDSQPPSPGRTFADSSPGFDSEETSAGSRPRGFEMETSTLAPMDQLSVGVAERASRAESIEEHAIEELAWDHSDELRELYQDLEALYAISPTGEQWRAMPARQTLAAPVGLARTQPASLQFDN